MQKNKKAVVLISGGMDSAVCTAIAKQMEYVVAGLHLNYGQRTERRELKAFNNIADFYDIQNKLIVDVSHLSQIGGSSLTDKKIKVAKAELDNSVIPISYVPFRNANILSIAVSWAEVIGADSIFIGAMQLDSSGYPDCRRDFFDAFEKAVELGTKPDTHIKILTPIIDYTKKDIVIEGTKLGVPFNLTWSCYKDEDIPCGECDSCALRIRGFESAGIPDPLNYR